MLVEEIMKKNVITIQPSTTIKEALEVMQKNKIRHLPVVAEEKLVGLVTSRHVSQACPSPLEQEEYNQILSKPVLQIMKTNIMTAHPLDFIEEVAFTMYEHHIGCLPILQNNKIVGIITETDILRTLIELTGIAHPSSQIEVEVDDQVGVLADIANIFKDHSINVSSVFIYPSKEPDKKTLVFRVRTINPRLLVESIKNQGHKVVWPRYPED